MPFQVVITKLDKLRIWNYTKTIDKYREALLQYKHIRPFLHLTSSLHHFGIVELHVALGTVTGLLDRIEKHHQKSKEIERRKMKEGTLDQIRKNEERRMSRMEQRERNTEK